MCRFKVHVTKFKKNLWSSHRCKKIQYAKCVFFVGMSFSFYDPVIYFKYIFIKLRLI